MQTLGSQLCRALRAHGVETVFGIPGVHNVELYRGIEDAGLSHILARHEQGAGFMADGYARATGTPGVAFVISGPGLTNIMTPMGQAYSDSVPLLAISSCLPVTAQMPGRLHQMRDQTGAGATVCDWSVMAESAQHALDLVDQAFDEFANSRPRPKHISIPIDVLAEILQDHGVSIANLTKIPVPTDQIENLAQSIDQANKPLFIFGAGASDAATPAQMLVQKSGAAAFTTYAGRGIINSDYPLLFGSTLARPDSRRVLAESDLLIAVGTELAEVDLGKLPLHLSGKLARVDIDQHTLDDLHKAHIKIHGDAGHVLEQLEQKVTASAPKWDLRLVRSTVQSFLAQVDREKPGVAPFVRAMGIALPDDTFIFSDMTQFAYVAKEIHPLKQPGLWHHPFGFGTLGYGLPAAIGGKIANPDRPVVAIAGDYGFQYTMQELGVAAELSLNLPIILWDNAKLKEIEDCMIATQIAPNAVVAQNPDFKFLAAAYGVGYVRPETPEQFQTALVDALQFEGPTIVHVSPLNAADR